MQSLACCRLLAFAGESCARKDSFNIAAVNVAPAQRQYHDEYNDLYDITIAHNNASSESRQWAYEAAAQAVHRLLQVDTKPPDSPLDQHDARGQHQ
jgi:hypothetical protein